MNFDSLTPEELSAIMEGFQAETDKAAGVQKVNAGDAMLTSAIAGRASRGGPRRGMFSQFLSGLIPGAYGGYQKAQGTEMQRASNEKAKAASAIILEALRRNQQGGPPVAPKAPVAGSMSAPSSPFGQFDLSSLGIPPGTM